MEFDINTEYPYNEIVVKKTFGEELKRLRRRTGLSQAMFADLIEISPRTLQDWEIDRYAPPNTHLIAMGIKQVVQKYLDKGVH